MRVQYLHAQTRDVPAPVSRSACVRFGEFEITGSIPGRDIPKSLTMVLAAPRLAFRLTGES